MKRRAQLPLKLPQAISAQSKIRRMRRISHFQICGKNPVL
jgi:hypothetical protein